MKLPEDIQLSEVINDNEFTFREKINEDTKIVFMMNSGTYNPDSKVKWAFPRSNKKKSK